MKIYWVIRGQMSLNAAPILTVGKVDPLVAMIGLWHSLRPMCNVVSSFNLWAFKLNPRPSIRVSTRNNQHPGVYAELIDIYLKAHLLISRLWRWEATKYG